VLLWPGAILIYLLFELLLRKAIFKTKEKTQQYYSFENLRDETNKGKKLFIYEYKVLDITDFLPLHPGKNLIDNYPGYEVGRFIYGGHFSKGYRNFHSNFAKTLIKKYQCGYLKPQFSLYDITAKNYTQAPQIWRMTERIKVTAIHAIIKFTCSQNEAIPFLYGVNHCGCHIAVFLCKQMVCLG